MSAHEAGWALGAHVAARRQGPTTRRPPAAVVLFLLLRAARPAAAKLVIESGPAPLRGTELLAAPFAFTPAAFADVRARLVLTHPDEWADASCPPKYVGPHSLRGAIVVSLDPSRSACSLESHARCAGAAGAVGWVLLRSLAFPLHPVPGWAYNAWWPGDERHLPETPAADITQRAAAPLLKALRAGEAVRARLTRSETEWANVGRTPAWITRDVVLGFQSLAVAELAVTRLRAFVRADGKLSPGIAQAVLLLEVFVQLVRLVSRCTTRGELPFPAVLFLMSLHLSIGTISSMLFLLYWAQAAWPSAGVVGTTPVASPTLAHSPRARRRLLALVVTIALFDVGVGLSFVITVPILMVVWLLIFAGLLPLLVLTVSAHTHWRARHVLNELPSGVARRLTRTMACSNGASALALVLSGSFPFVQVRPWPLYAVGFVFLSALNVASAMHAAAFAPLGVPLMCGPIERASAAVLSGLAMPRLARALGFGGRGTVAPRQHEVSHLPIAQNAASPEAGPPRQRSEAPAANAGGGDGVLVPPPLGPHTIFRSHQRAQFEAGFRAREHLLLGVQLGYVREMQRALNVGSSVSSFEVGLRARRLSLALAHRSRLGVGGGGEPCSLAEIVAGQHTPDGSPAVGRANLFVSHAQRCPFDATLSAVEAYARLHGLKPSETYIWIDVLCIRQAVVRTEVRYIGEIQRAAGRVVLVLQPWTAPVCLTRAWCLYEVLVARRLGLPIGLALPTEELRSVASALAGDRASLELALSQFDVRQSISSVEEDRAIIFSMIEQLFDDAETAPEAFNRETHAALREGLAAFSWSAVV